MTGPGDAQASRTKKTRARKKHVPQRTCVACRAVRDKRELVRLVRTPEGQLVVDKTGKQNGRGAYLCRQRSCWEAALNGRQLGKALKIEIGERERQVLRDAIAREFDPLASAD
jgi:predicted RNA-binding protein YlxR (DUF448 family)